MFLLNPENSLRLKITRLYTLHTFTVSNRDPFKKKKKTENTFAG